MKTKLIAILVSEGSRFLSQYLRLRTHTLPEPAPPAISEITYEAYEAKEKSSAKSSEIPTGCVPCSIGHLGTCSGLLNEAIRFANKDGVGSPEVIDRVGMCLDELNALERVDLRPEMIDSLPEWERIIAQDALSTSRNTRHDLEDLKSPDQLNQIAANTQRVRRDIAQRWFGEKYKALTPKEKKQLDEKVSDKIELAMEGKGLEFDPHFAINLQSELKKEFEGRGER